MYWLSLIFTLYVQAEKTAETQFHITVQKPEHHYYQINMAFPERPDAAIRTIEMAQWIPGSYKIRDFAQHVRGLQATDLEGNAIALVQISKSKWQVGPGAEQGFRIQYDLFAYEYTVRNNYLDNSGGFLNPCSAAFYETDKQDRPVTVVWTLPLEWRAASGLKMIEPNRFHAANWDILADSPFLIGKLKRYEFDVNGIPHSWNILGDPAIDFDAATSALKKMAEVTLKMFDNKAPFNDYHFLTAFRPGDGRGGLEHANSTLTLGRFYNFYEQDHWEYFMGLAAHEYFHAWNVKALRDQKLMTYNYKDEIYTDLLWFHEGFTSYFDIQLLGRAGILDSKSLLKEWSRIINEYKNTPGRLRQSLRDASFNAWIHYYQQDQSFTNDQVSYYRVGSLTALCLDLLIRHKTDNQSSLDQVMNLLYQRHAETGITYDIILETVAEVGGKSAASFLENAVSHPEDLPLEKFITYAGYELVPAAAEDAEEKAEKPYFKAKKVSLGIKTKDQGKRVFVDQVNREGAGWKAGLDFGDEILAVNESRVEAGNLDHILIKFFPGDQVRILVARKGRVLTLNLTLEEELGPLKPKPLETVTDQQTAIGQALFGTQEEKKTSF